MAAIEREREREIERVKLEGKRIHQIGMKKTGGRVGKRKSK